jgi:hypothetical protein
MLNNLPNILTYRSVDESTSWTPPPAKYPDGTLVALKIGIKWNGITKIRLEQSVVDGLTGLVSSRPIARGRRPTPTMAFADFCSITATFTVPRLSNEMQSGADLPG